MTKRQTTLLGLLGVAIVLFPSLSGNAYFLTVMIFVGIHVLVALGLTMLMGFAGQLSLCQAAFYGLGAYGTAVFSVKAGLPALLSIPLAVGLACGVALILGIPALKLKGHYLAMATLGFGVIVHIILDEEVGWTGGPSGLGRIPRFRLLGHVIRDDVAYYYLVWSVVLLALIFCLQVIHSRVGRALRAIHEQETAAEAMGVPTAHYKVRVFILSAILAALAGSLYAHYVTFLTPSSFNLMWSIRFVLMVMVGGMQNIWGALLGTVLMTFIGNEWLQVFAEFEILVYGVILLVVALFLPQGLVSLWDQLPLRRAQRSLK